MTFKLRDLPFKREDFVPYLSPETIDFHYGKHHDTYVNNLNRLIVGTEFEGSSLVEIIRKASGAIFNNAAQVWNHDFYWDCLSSSQENQRLSSELSVAFDNSFGGFDKFKEAFTKEALSFFGSGWIWLVKVAGKLEIRTTGNAFTPISTEEAKPLLVCDLWEHAYYIDYRNARAKYLEAFWQIVNWQFVSKNIN